MRLSPVGRSADLHIDALGLGLGLGLSSTSVLLQPPPPRPAADNNNNTVRHLSHSAAAASSVALAGAVAGVVLRAGAAAGGVPRPDMGAGPADYDATASLTAPARGKVGGSSAIASLPPAGPLLPLPSQAQAPAPQAPLSTPEFFSLLTKHVAPSHLETLMAALGAFNRGKMDKSDLLGVAEQTLRLPASVAAARGLPDLVLTFKSLILRVAVGSE